MIEYWKKRIAVILFIFLFPLTIVHGEEFIRGDANGDAGIDLSDAVFVLRYLFTGGSAPACEDSADMDDSGKVDISDAAYLLNHLFKGGPTLVAPYPDLGYDWTPDGFVCGDAAQGDESDELAIFDLGDGTHLFYEEGVSSSILIEKDLFDLYRRVSVSLKEVDSDKSITLYSLDDVQGFGFSSHELRVLVNTWGQELEDGQEYKLSLDAITLREGVLKKEVRVFGEKRDFQLQLLANQELKKDYISLASSTPDLPKPPEPGFCKALDLKMYRCENRADKILDENDKDTSLTVDKILSVLGTPITSTLPEVMKQLGDKLKEPEKSKTIREKFWKRGGCFLMVGFVDASDLEHVKDCLEGQELQMTQKMNTNFGELIGCTKSYGGPPHLTLAYNFNTNPRGSDVRCYEDPDPAEKCVAHVDDPAKKFGHSPNYIGDDYHTLNSVTNSYAVPYEIQGVTRPVPVSVTVYHKAHWPFPRDYQDGAPLMGKRFLVVWYDAPGASSFSEEDWDKPMFALENGDEVRLTGDMSRKDRFHTYLLSSECKTTGQAVTDKGKHVCLDVEYRYPFRARPSDGDWSEGPVYLADCGGDLDSPKKV